MSCVRWVFVLLLGSLFISPPVFAFCGFYVARADAGLFNKASQVVLVRDEERTVLTMANDFRGEPKEFALVIPVPSLIRREQIHIGDKAVIDHLDAYTAPRLVEYFDDDPCRVDIYRAMEGAPVPLAGARGRRAKALGVTVEASYTVGEYDIVILSAEQSEGLTLWLNGNGYRIPDGAAEVLESYIKQKTRFFVAKVNLEEQARLGFRYLRPIQIAYESPKFMLPIRLGTLNADGAQELFIYTLTRKGRVETTNYRTVKLPTGMDIPPFVKTEFSDFYRALFDEQVKKERMQAVFLEYAWDMNWCDPCAADPLSDQELRGLGVYWVKERPLKPIPRVRPLPGNIMPPVPPRAGRNVFVTRLHVRYDAAHFPEDLRFQETGDRTNFQGRFVLRHPWKGESQCAAADRYLKRLKERLDNEAKTLANLTGWDINDIRRKMDLPGTAPRDRDEEPWWKKIWSD